MGVIPGESPNYTREFELIVIVLPRLVAALFGQSAHGHDDGCPRPCQRIADRVP